MALKRRPCGRTMKIAASTNAWTQKNWRFFRSSGLGSCFIFICNWCRPRAQSKLALHCDRCSPVCQMPLWWIIDRLWRSSHYFLLSCSPHEIEPVCSWTAAPSALHLPRLRLIGVRHKWIVPHCSVQILCSIGSSSPCNLTATSWTFLKSKRWTDQPICS